MIVSIWASPKWVPTVIVVYSNKINSKSAPLEVVIGAQAVYLVEVVVVDDGVVVVVEVDVVVVL